MIDESDKAELAQLLREFDEFEKEVRARQSLMRRRLLILLGGKRTTGPKVFEFHSNGKVRVIKMRGLADE